MNVLRIQLPDRRWVNFAQFMELAVCVINGQSGLSLEDGGLCGETSGGRP